MKDPNQKDGKDQEAMEAGKMKEASSLSSDQLSQISGGTDPGTGEYKNKVVELPELDF